MRGQLIFVPSSIVQKAYAILHLHLMHGGLCVVVLNSKSVSVYVLSIMSIPDRGSEFSGDFQRFHYPD